MLGRTALPLLRPRAVRFPISTSLSSQQARWASKGNKSFKAGNFKIHPPSPSSTSSGSTQRSADPTSKTSRPQEGQDFLKEQTEFENTSESQNNTAQKTAESETGSPGTGSAQHQDVSSSTSHSESDPSAKDQTDAGSVHPQQPLPDLTQGIPSTLGQEVEARSKRRGSTSLNLTEDPEFSSEGGAGEGGDIPKDAYVSSLERRRNRLANLSYALLFAMSVAGTAYLGRNWDTAEEEDRHPEAPSGWGFGLFFNRIKARASDITSYYKDPAFEKLLPDDDSELRPPYTLVISLEDLLVHSEWTREHGWRVAKRPGVDYFIRYLNQYYEIVLFTSVPSMMADQVLRKLDPFRIIRWPLFREATKYEDGEYIKDLSYLNRDLSKVILVDTHSPHAKRQPENSIILPKWKGDPKDKDLVSLIPFLEYVAGMGIEDVRTVIKSFDDTHIPTEFAKREKAMREKFEKQLAEERAKRPKHSISGFASMLGVKPMGPSIDGLDHAEGFDKGKMLWDQIRERGQKQYQMIDKEIRENGEKWLKEMSAEEEKFKEEQMNSMKSSFTGFFRGGGSEK